MDDKLLKLRNYLKDKGLTQVKIAELFNVDKGYINQLLTGRKAFGKRTAEEWSDQFGLSKSWLLTGDGDMFGGSVKNVDGSPCFDLVTIQGGAGQGNGMEQPHIARIEAGRYSVGVDILGKIATALGKRVDIVD